MMQISWLQASYKVRPYLKSAHKMALNDLMFPADVQSAMDLVGRMFGDSPSQPAEPERTHSNPLEASQPNPASQSSGLMSTSLSFVTQLLSLSTLSFQVCKSHIIPYVAGRVLQPRSLQQLGTRTPGARQSWLLQQTEARTRQTVLQDGQLDCTGSFQSPLCL